MLMEIHIAFRKECPPKQINHSHMPKFRYLLTFAGVANLGLAVEIKPVDKGLNINGGSLGDFQLGYPVFSDGGKEIHPLVEARANGAQATLKYEGGGSVKVVTTGSGDVTLDFSGTPADVKSFSTTMLVDISFNRGGKWKIGEKEGGFPKDKATPAHIFSGSNNSISISNAVGDRLDIGAPDYSFMQLTDNREWGWSIYAWKCFVNVSPGMKSAKFKIGISTGRGDARIVDAFGQSMLDDWPGKVKAEDELKADVAEDEAYYASLKTPPLDPYGGLPGSGGSLGLKNTGFFHIEQKSGKSWLVDPSGNAFFHLGICGFQPSDDYTWVEGRENIYSWLPAKSDPKFASAYRNGTPQAFSFHVANTIRKFGLPYDLDQFGSRMINRVRKFSGESANTGIFSVTDRPWKPMVEEMAKTNHGIHDVLSGKTKPFAWEHAKARGGN